jgi:hypothetical protein
MSLEWINMGWTGRDESDLIDFSGGQIQNAFVLEPIGYKPS